MGCTLCSVMESQSQADDFNTGSSAEKNCKYFQILWSSFLQQKHLFCDLFFLFFFFLLVEMGPAKYLLFSQHFPYLVNLFRATLACLKPVLLGC